MDADEDILDTRRSVQDPVHGYMNFGSYVWQVVDTKHFQRLRELKQLGTSYYVWPGASHNRFEHSLGTAYLARCMVMHLKNCQPSLGINDRDVKCVELAGLCHDLEHGPWSHVWDTLYIPRALKGTKHAGWQHEDASEMMLDDLVKVYEIGLPAHDVKFIKALIAGDPKRVPEEKPFLFEIVANKRNGIDVDKFDYIARDGRAVGDNQNLTLTRLISSARVIEGQICWDHKDANQMYELCYTRFSLHKRIYSHKTAKAIEYMLIDAVLAAEPTLQVAEQIKDPKRYVHLTDSIKSRIELEDPSKPGIAEAQAILERISGRQLYRCIDAKVFDYSDKADLEKHITPAAIVEKAKQLKPGELMIGDDDDVAWEELDKVIDPVLQEELMPDHVIVSLATLHYGMKEKNPLDFIKFYTKKRPNECLRPGRGDLSTLQPETFAEVQLRVYTKHTRFAVLVQAGYRALLHDVVKHALDSPSPMPTPAPSPSPAFSGPSQGEPRTPPPPQEKRTLRKATSFVAAAKNGDTSPLVNPFYNIIRSSRTVSPSRGSGHARARSAADVDPPALLLPTRVGGEDDEPAALFPRKRRRTVEEPEGDLFGVAVEEPMKKL